MEDNINMLSLEEINKIIMENKKLKEDLKQKEDIIKKNNEEMKQKEKQINDLKQKEYILKSTLNNFVYFIDKKVYEEYDKSQEETTLEKKMDVEQDNKDAQKKYDEFKEIIDKIDINSKNKKCNNLSPVQRTNIINHKIDSQLEKDKFTKAFKDAIEQNINKNWNIDDRIKLRNLMDQLYEKEIKELFLDLVPQHIIQMRMDLLLDIVLSDEYDNEIELETFILKSNNYSNNPLNKGIKCYDPYTKKNIIFNKDYILNQILNNIGIINGYYKTIQKFVNDNYKPENLIDKLKDIVKNTNIYFCDMPKGICGITVCSGDIFINAKYMQESIHEINDQFYNYVGVSKIFLTLLHEYAHKLHYIIRAEENVNNKDYCNFFVKTFIKKTDKIFKYLDTINVKDKNDYIDTNLKKLEENEFEEKILYSNLHEEPIIKIESGNFFDKEIYLGQNRKDVTKNICRFFMSHTCDNYRDYVSIMHFLLFVDKQEKSRNSTYRLFLEEGPECLFSFIRKENKS